MIRILYVEDVDDDVLLLKRALRAGRLRAEVVQVRTDTEFRAALAGEDCHAIVADYALPGYGGLDALASYRELLVDRPELRIPFLVLSGHVGEEQAVALMRAGAADCILKDNLSRFVPALRRELRDAAVRKDRQRARSSLRSSEAQYRRLLDTLPHGVEVIDIEGRTIYVNDAYRRLFGSPERVQSAAVDYRSRVLFSDQPGSFDTTLVRADGAVAAVHVDFAPDSSPNQDGRVGGYTLVLTDVTERREAEEELRRNEEKFSTLFARIPDPIVVADNDGTIVDVNDAFSTVLGYDREAVIGRTALEIGLWVSREDRRDVIERFLREGVLSSHETRIRGADGSVRTMSLAVTPIFIDGRRFNLWIGRDMTEFRRVQEALNRRRKLEAVGTMAGGIAHDFNNILSVIFGHAEMLLAMPEISETVRTAADEMLTASRRARDLTRRILTFSRNEETNPRVVSIQPIVEETVRLLRASAPEGVVVRSRLAARRRVYADPAQLHQVVMNLCTNALHAVQGTGGVITVGLRDEGTDLILSVSDTGPGIPAEVAGRIFEPFFTTKDVDEGSGMGLSVVDGIVTNLAGTIELNPGGDGGPTEFRVRIPAIVEHIAKEEEDGANPGRRR